MLRLLIADQPKDDRDSAKHLFAELGFAVTIATGALDALARCEAAIPDLIIVDAALPNALELIAAVRLMARGTHVRILYGVADADLRRLMAAKRAGADDFLLQPYDLKVLHALFDEMLSKSVAAA
jgi:two-component system, chemotaxis family, chemotaxis protein CheY